MIDDLGGVEAYVASLNERAEVAVEKQKPIKLYIRSADLVFRQVQANPF